MQRVFWNAAATSYSEAATKANLALKHSDIEEQYQSLQSKSYRRNRAGKHFTSEDEDHTESLPSKTIKSSALSKILCVPKASMSDIAMKRENSPPINRNEEFQMQAMKLEHCTKSQKSTNYKCDETSSSDKLLHLSVDSNISQRTFDQRLDENLTHQETANIVNHDKDQRGSTRPIHADNPEYHNKHVPKINYNDTYKQDFTETYQRDNSQKVGLKITNDKKGYFFATTNRSTAQVFNIDMSECNYTNQLGTGESKTEKPANGHLLSAPSTAEDENTTDFKDSEKPGNNYHVHQNYEDEYDYFEDYNKSATKQKTTEESKTKNSPIIAAPSTSAVKEPQKNKKRKNIRLSDEEKQINMMEPIEKIDYLIALNEEILSQERNNTVSFTLNQSINGLSSHEITMLQDNLLCDSEMKLRNLNVLISTEVAFSDKLKAYFKTFKGSSTVEQYVRTLLRNCVDDKVGVLYSGKGQKEKKSFKKLPLYNLILHETLSMYKGISQQTIFTITSNWLKGRQVSLNYKMQAKLKAEAKAKLNANKKNKSKGKGKGKQLRNDDEYTHTSSSED